MGRSEACVNPRKSRRRSIQATRKDTESSGRALLRQTDLYIRKGLMRVESTIRQCIRTLISLHEYERYISDFFIADSRDLTLSGG